MKAVQIDETGGVDRLQLREINKPRCPRTGVLVKIHFSGVNFIDIYHRTGTYGLPPLPTTLGREGVGEIVEVGERVKHFSLGERVVFIMGGSGSYAEYAAVNEKLLLRIPAAVSDELAVAVAVQGLTAHYLINDSYAVKAGETVLIHAAAGGVGLLLTQWAKLKGARVIATVSSEKKKQLALAAGADEVIIYENYDFLKETRRLTEQKGVHVVYDAVGEKTFLNSLKATRVRGKVVLYGQSSGMVPPFDPYLLNTLGSLSVTRPSLAHFILSRAESDSRSAELFGLVEAGKLTVRIEKSYALEAAAEAQADLEERRSTGKLLLKI